MLNVEHPHLQACYEDVIALHAARDADVVDRLLNPDRESFVRDLHAIADEVEFYEYTADEKRVIKRVTGRKPTDVERTTSTILNIGAYVEDDRDITPHQLMLDVINDITKHGVSSHREKLHTITCLGLIAGQHKPPEDRLAAMWKGMPMFSKKGLEDFEAPDEDVVFRYAVTALDIIRDALRSGEEEAIAAKLDTFRDRVKTGNKLRQAVDTLNRYDYGRLARRTLELVMRPSTTRRDTLDEVAVMLGDVKPPLIPEPTPGYTGPVVSLPWPILPPPERKRDSDVERPVEDKPPRSREPREIIRDELRTAWLGMLAMRWPYYSEITPIDLHSIGEEELSEYDGAFLWGPDNVTLFACVGESAIAIPHNSLHIAVAFDLRDELGNPVPVQQALGGGKQRAVRIGSVQKNHTGKDTYKRAIDHLRDRFLAQYKFPLLLIGEEPEES
jgi:hypothetical protein